MADFRNDSCIAALIGAIEEYRSAADCRDEVFWEVGARIREQGEATTLDVVGLAAWWFGRLDQPNVASLLDATNASVRAMTRSAFGTALTDKQRMDRLEGLPAFGAGAWWMRWGSRPRRTRIEDASPLLVVLACWNPDEFCIGGRQSIDYGLWSIQRPVFAGERPWTTWRWCASSATFAAIRSRT